ncbi:MAG: CoA transferase, partial [Gammaproteobacteria bacterium]|nr:CoA transferase [Gammaproteobacteria bacterium]
GLDLAQTRHREMCLEDASGKEHLGTPLKFRHEPAALRLEAPAHGAHTTTILSSLGYTDDDIAHLREDGVV